MAMTRGSRYTLVPDVIDAIVAMFNAAALEAAAGLPVDADGDPAEFVVFDGEATSELPANYWMVGYNAAFAAQAFGGTTGLAVEGTRVLSETGNRQFGESFIVWCEASTFTGDSDGKGLARARRNTAGVISALWATIEVDPTELLPGDVVTAISDHDESGCHCDVRVTVRRLLDGIPA